MLDLPEKEELPEPGFSERSTTSSTPDPVARKIAGSVSVHPRRRRQGQREVETLD